MTTAPAKVEPTPAANPAPSSAPEAKANAPTLDNLLAEFETTPPPAPAAKSEPTPPNPTPAPKAELRVEEATALRGLLASEAKRQADEGVSAAIKTIKGSEALSGVSDKFVSGVLYEKAATDQRFLQAFMQRATKPEAWKAVLKAVGSEIESEISSASATKLASDRARVQASVRGLASAPVSANPVSNEEWGRLSPGRFQKAKQLMAAGKTDRQAFDAVISPPR